MWSAQHGGQELGGESVVVLERRGVGDPDDDLLVVLGPEEGLEGARPLGGDGLAIGGRALPSSSNDASRQLDDPVPVGLAGEGEDDVRRAVLPGRSRPASGRPLRLVIESTVPMMLWPSGWLAEVRGLGGVVGDGHRVIQVHPDFLDDHLFLGLEVFLAEAGSEDVGEDIERLGQVFGQAGDVVEGVFLGRLRVVLGAHAVEVAIDGQRVAAGRPLEDHVLEEVRDPGQLGRLVAAPRLHEEPRGDRPRLVVQLGDHLEPIVEDGLMESHGMVLLGDCHGIQGLNRQDAKAAEREEREIQTIQSNIRFSCRELKT